MYSDEIESMLQKEKIKISDKIRIEKDDTAYEGLLMPKSAGSEDTLIIKLDNGYNVGISMPVKIKKLESGKPVKAPIVKKEQKPDKSKPLISILSTGGTVASKIDYKTGAAYPAFTPEELFSAVPELKEIANFNIHLVFQMYSGDMEPEHWVLLAKRIFEEMEEVSPDGIIITHGTDTMAYTAAALSFMLQNLPIPVILVGAQRSSDRGSSDTQLNLICAARFISESAFSGVAICMHGSIETDYCLIHPGLHVKKMHSARRDTFRSIDVLPYAEVRQDGEIKFLRQDYVRKDKSKKVHLVGRFDRRIGLVKIYPGIDYRIFDFFLENGYRGLLLEGTGLGNAPVNVLDEYTQHHKDLLDNIKKLVEKGVVVAMVTQTPYGKVNMNVYSYGRKLLDVGVIPLAMTSEAAYVKLGWVLGHTRDSEEAKQMLQKNYVGEFIERINERAFLF